MKILPVETLQCVQKWQMTFERSGLTLVHLAELQTKSINVNPDSIVVFQEQDLKDTPD